MTQVETPTAAPRPFADVYAEYIGLLQFAISKFRFPLQVQEDLIQEAFLRYLENQVTLGTQNPKCFLVTIARNLAIDFYRKQKRRHMDQHYPVEDVMHELLQDNVDERALQVQTVAHFLHSLRDDPQARTLVQYYDEDLSIKEIAALSQESTATIASRLSRQRQRYRARLEQRIQATGYAYCST